MMLLSGCGYNKQIIDLDYSYKHAIIDGIGKVEITAWNEYEDSDMIQVVTKDKTVYYTYASNVILISK